MPKRTAREWDEDQQNRRILTIEQAVQRAFTVRAATHLQYEITCLTEHLREVFFPFFETHLDRVIEPGFGLFLFETVDILNTCANRIDTEVRAFVDRVISIKRARFE